MPEVTILEEAHSIVTGARNEEYGEPRDDFATSARMMSAYLSRKYQAPIELTPEDVPALMICVKLSRLANGFKRDSLLDIAGYAATWESVINANIRDLEPVEPANAPRKKQR